MLFVLVLAATFFSTQEAIRIVRSPTNTKNYAFYPHSYVTYVQGSEYIEHAVRLTASLHETGSLHKYPHIYMVKEGSVDEQAAQKLQAAATEIGWNLKIESYKPIDIKFHTWLSNWDEAWQRVTLYNMTNRFGRVLHIDADAFVFENVDEILEKAEVPSVARRMGGCKHSEQICSSQPVSNFMVLSPDVTIWNKLTEKLDALNDINPKKSPDETIQFNYHEHVNLLSPQDAIYSDCFWNQDDSQLSAAGLDVNNLPRIVHLGRAGKTMINQMKQNAGRIRARLETEKKSMALKLLDKAESLQGLQTVQAILKVLDKESAVEQSTNFKWITARDTSSSALISEKHQFSDICD